METSYQQFLAGKATSCAASGFEANPRLLNEHLFDFQRHIVARALRAGRYAVFADCGLGKTLMQLEWAGRVVAQTSRPVVILTPLAVAAQTVEEAAKFGISGVVRWSVGMGETPEVLRDLIYVAHYEQLDSIPAWPMGGVVLDESSILKNYEGKMRNALLDAFSHTPYKLCCTATPSPNDSMELGNHAEFLGVMTRQQMLAMYFVHDGGDTSQWRLKGHCQSLFWNWVAGWAIMLASPADIGFDGSTYQLPALTMLERTIVTPKRENGRLFNDVAVSATNFNQELRLTKVERLSEVAAIVNESDEPFLIWIKQNEEGDELKKLIPGAVEVRGNDSPELKEARLLGFAKGEFRVLITKTKIAQFGLNYQHCSHQVFASLDFSFEGLYQAIRRSYRFGQSRPVTIYLITTDTMQNVIETIKRKQAQFAQMQRAMTRAVCQPTTAIESILSQPMKRPQWLQSLCK